MSVLYTGKDYFLKICCNIYGNKGHRNPGNPQESRRGFHFLLCCFVVNKIFCWVPLRTCLEASLSPNYEYLSKTVSKPIRVRFVFERK